ncbi:MAG: PEP-utilizing enzyme [Candidatus Nanoarchaeia archaeon]|nr:PEP-utilizing enzyme [Candidatus Nanoarchaeia archaeon]
MDLNKIGRVKWYHDVSNQRSPVYVGWALMNCFAEHNEYYGRTIKDCMFAFENVCVTRICYSERDIKEGAEALLRNYSGDHLFLEKTEKIVLDRGKKFIETSRQGWLNSKDKDLKDLLKSLKIIQDYRTKFFAYSMIPELSAEILGERFDEELIKQFGNKSSEYGAILSIPRESELRRAERELVDISKKKNFNSLLKDYVKKYFWISNNYIDTVYLDEKYFRNKLEGIDMNASLDLSKKKKLMDSLKDKKYDTLRAITDIIESLAFIQDYRKKVFMETSYYTNEILRIIGKEKGYELMDMFLFNPDEMYDLKRTVVSDEELSRRRKKIVFYYHEGDFGFYSGEEAVKVENMIAPLKIPEGRVFNGRGTYPGKIKGEARVIKSFTELNTLKQGEILVTGNTTPDYLPFLKRARAIITEKGGLTCHAAIISRELKVPCIVGVSNITLALKTGDMIEVDSEKGVVKKIK